MDTRIALPHGGLALQRGVSLGFKSGGGLAAVDPPLQQLVLMPQRLGAITDIPALRDHLTKSAQLNRRERLRRWLRGAAGRLDRHTKGRSR